MGCFQPSSGAVIMTTVTLTSDKTPSQQIVDDGNEIKFVTDAKGRSIGVRKIKMSIRRRVLKTLTAASAGKGSYLGLCMMAASVDSIDGEKVAFPSTELQFDALIDRIDDEGLEAISSTMVDDEEGFKNSGE
jgi:hypothetical protein